MDLKVIDNILPPYQFQQIQSILMEDTFPWFYNRHANADSYGFEIGTYHGRSVFQFTHTLFHDGPPWNGVGSNYYSIVQNCISGLDIKKLYRIKINLLTPTLFHQNTGWHCDNCGDASRTAVYYINTNNGYTKFKKSGKIVKSVANRMVIFPSDLEHAGFSCTDKKVRVLINFNYG